MKGKTKGTFKGKSKPKRKSKAKTTKKKSGITGSFLLTLSGEYSLIGVQRLEDLLRKIVREELDKTIQSLKESVAQNSGRRYDNGFWS